MLLTMSPAIYGRAPRHHLHCVCRSRLHDEPAPWTGKMTVPTSAILSYTDGLQPMLPAIVQAPGDDSRKHRPRSLSSGENNDTGELLARRGVIRKRKEWWELQYIEGHLRNKMRVRIRIACVCRKSHTLNEGRVPISREWERKERCRVVSVLPMRQAGKRSMDTMTSGTRDTGCGTLRDSRDGIQGTRYCSKYRVL